MAADTHTDTSQSYTVVLRGEAFQLSHSQIYFDSPNYLTTCFSSGFAESRNRTLRLDRSPALFAIIVDYLSGYTVLPISPRAIPPTMTEATALDNLLADARFYDLQGLQNLIFSTERGVGDLTWMGLANETVLLRDVLAHELPHGVIERDDGSVVSTDGLPVLVSARDMLATFTYFIPIALTSEDSIFGGQTALTVECSWAGSTSSDRSQSPDLNIVRCHTDGQLSINGKVYAVLPLNSALIRREADRSHPLMRHLECGFSPIPCYTSHDHYRIRSQSFTFWVDEMLCCMEKRSLEGAPASDAVGRPAQLVRATLRSPYCILAGIKAP